MRILLIEFEIGPPVNDAPPLLKHRLLAGLPQLICMASLQHTDFDPLSATDSHPLSDGSTLQRASPAAPPPPPPPPRDPVADFLGRPVPNKPHSETSVPQTPDGVLTLARAGMWRAAASLSERLLGLSHPVDVLLTLRWYHIVALLKLQDVPKAEREMAMLGDLRSQGWHYERYPGQFPGKTGSMVPYALLVLHALLPSYSGNHDNALSRLYALIAHETAAAAQGSDGDGSRRLGERAQAVLAVVNVLCAVHDYPNAIAHLEQLVAAVQRSPRNGGAVQGTTAEEHDADAALAPTSYDPAAPAGSERVAPPDATQLLSLLGRLQLQVGNLPGAEGAFQRLEALISDADASSNVRINRGLLAMARGEHPAALGEFEAAQKVDPTSSLAANNAAVCQLYCCNLADAVKTLEHSLRADPASSLQHPVLVANLANLYQMTSPPGGGSQKPTLERLVAATAPDDFDFGVLTLGQ